MDTQEKFIVVAVGAGDMTSFLESLTRVIDSLGRAFEAIKVPCENFWRAYQYNACYLRFDLQPSERHALAGYPYGKHTRGKKRWLREMRRLA